MSSLLPEHWPGDWQARPAWDVLASRDEFGGQGPQLSLSVARGVRPREVGEGRAASENTEHYRVVRSGDLVINRLVARDGAISISKLDGLISPAYWVLRPRWSHNDARFIAYQLRSSPYLAEIGRISKDMPPAQFDLPWDQFRRLPIALPREDQQRAIADYLDTETARIDALIARKERLVGVLGERVAAEVEECLVKAGTQVPLRRLLAEPPQYGAGESGETAVEGHPRYIRITDLTADGLLRRENAKSLPPEVARPYMLSDGDLLVARSGATAGKAFLYAREMGAACYAGYLIRLRFNQDMVDSRLLELWMQTAHYRGQISESAVQATIQNVNAERYKSLLVPLPAREDQGSLASSLLQARGRSRRLAHEFARQVALLQEHRQALITAAVSGELEVPGVAA